MLQQGRELSSDRHQGLEVHRPGQGLGAGGRTAFLIGVPWSKEQGRACWHIQECGGPVRKLRLAWG